MSDKYKLDGTEKVENQPFDAHDRVLRTSGEYQYSEYPKAVAHDKETGEPVVARDADHEAELLEQFESHKEE